MFWRTDGTNETDGHGQSLEELSGAFKKVKVWVVTYQNKGVKAPTTIFCQKTVIFVPCFQQNKKSSNVLSSLTKGYQRQADELAF